MQQPNAKPQLILISSFSVKCRSKICLLFLYKFQNSIRHNLSLHNKFIRVQNEGTGKSSWWMLNPDAKPGKAARRRATSMETSKYEKRRGRIRKRIEALKNGTTVLDTPSPCSSLGEGLDVFPGSDESPSVILLVI